MIIIGKVYYDMINRYDDSLFKNLIQMQLYKFTDNIYHGIIASLLVT